MADTAVYEIDQFHEHVESGRQRRNRYIEQRAHELPEDLQEHLAYEYQKLEAISDLADEFSIIALYRAIETLTGRMLAHEFGPSAQRWAGNITILKQQLQNQKGVDLEKVPHFRVMNELRLLNNSIKHNDSKVSQELSRNYPRWKQGKPLTLLDQAYNRLSPRVPTYIYRLAESIRLKYK